MIKTIEQAQDSIAPNADLEKGKYRVIVNGRQKIVDSDEVTFEEVIRLTFDPPPSGPYIVFTVSYRNGAGRPPEGRLVSGQKVKVQDGTIFNVTATDKS